jgi:putative transposase
MPSGMPYRIMTNSALAAAMSMPRRNASPNNIAAGARTFFVTLSTWGRRPLLQSDRSARLFIRTLYEYRTQEKYSLQEFVVMPDHFHLLITLGCETTIERAVQLIKGGFAFTAGKELGMRAPVWQKGFSESRILDVAAFGNSRAYIRQNPVVRRLTMRPDLYPYCSAHPAFELDPPPQRLKPLNDKELIGTPEGVP